MGQVLYCFFFEESDFREKFISLHIFNMIPLRNFYKSPLCVDIEKSSELKFLKLVQVIQVTDSPFLIYTLFYFPSSLKRAEAAGEGRKSHEELDPEAQALRDFQCQKGLVGLRPLVTGQGFSH